MITNFKIHFWDIQGYVNIKFEFKKQIKKRILSKNSINKFASQIRITSMSLYYFLNNKENFIRIKNFVEILNILKIPLRLAEKYISYYRDTCSKRPFKIKFPYHFTPIDMRIISVLFGDGNVNKENGLARWIQKDVDPLKRLLEHSLKAQIGTNGTHITIPAFFTKITAKTLNLKKIELNSIKLIKRSLKLPKDYKLALLIALIEDEGNIDVKNYSGVSLRISSKQGIYLISQLCGSLEYKTSKIRKYQNNGFGNNTMYKICILSEGIEKLGFDILEFEKEYGLLASLWTKRENLYKRWKVCTGDRSKKNREGAKLRKDITKLFKKYNQLTPKEIAIKLNIKRTRAQDLIRIMYNKKELIRIKYGSYTLNKN